MHRAEIRSIGVPPQSKGRGVGRSLVNALMEEARRRVVTCVCLFTRTPEFFEHLGCEIVRREMLPDKIYKNCVHYLRIAMRRKLGAHLGVSHMMVARVCQ